MTAAAKALATDVEAAVHAVGLTRRFGRKTVLGPVDLQVSKGAICGFVGANGAGKTTTLKLILGLLRPSEGTVSVLGYDIVAQRPDVARRVGAVLERHGFYGRATGRQNLELAAQMLNSSRREVDRVLDLVEMRDHADRVCGHYSLGQRQRLAIARALINQPSLLVLDEPTNGLDPQAHRALIALVKRLVVDTGVTAIISSHDLVGMGGLLDEICFFSNGALLKAGRINTLGDELPRVIRLDVRESGRAKALLSAERIAWAEAEDGALLVRGALDPESVDQIARLMIGADIALRSVAVQLPTLQALYDHALAHGGAND